MNNNQFSKQAVLPVLWLGVSSARLLVLLAFLATAAGAQDILSEVFNLEHKDGIKNDGTNFLFDAAECEVSPENKTQKN